MRPRKTVFLLPVVACAFFFFLAVQARAYCAITSESGQNFLQDASLMGREHGPAIKTRAFKSGYGATDYSDLQRERAKSGLEPERKINALISIKDYRGASYEAGKLVEDQPGSINVWKAYLLALAKAGDERKLLSVFRKFQSLFPEDCKKREILEIVAWGIIEKGGGSSSPLIRVYACLGAFMGQDAKSINVLKKAAGDSNPQIRALFAKLSSNFRDAALQDEILCLLKKERHDAVRAEVVKAVGRMKIRGGESQLLDLLSSSNTLDEERAAAIEALVNLFEKAERKEIQQLVLSCRSGLRELACRVVSHTFDYSNLDLIIPLLEDHCSDVRCSAAQTLGLLRLKDAMSAPVIKHLADHLQDPDPYTAISAAWAMTLYDPQRGLEAFGKWISHPNRDVRHFASGALAQAGKYGIPLIESSIEGCKDPIVQVNLALGLIGQRKQTKQATQIVSSFIETMNERVMWRDKGKIRYLAKSSVKFSAILPNQPDLVDQMARLELLNVVAVMEDEQAPVVARNFLKKRAWGVTGLAAALLLTEGDDHSLEIVEELLNDPDRKVRVQAALILALWGRGENAIFVLQEAYSEADRSMKERILEGIGQIGSDSSIPFLIEALHEPFQTLRIIAASSLLNCLYH